MFGYIGFIVVEWSCDWDWGLKVSILKANYFACVENKVNNISWKKLTKASK